MSPMTIEQRLAALGGEDAALNPDEIFAGHRRRRRRQVVAGSLAAAVLLGGGVWGATALGHHQRAPQIAASPTSTATSTATATQTAIAAPTSTPPSVVRLDTQAAVVTLTPTAPAKAATPPATSRYCSTPVTGWARHISGTPKAQVVGFATGNHNPQSDPLFAYSVEGELRWYPQGLSGRSVRVPLAARRGDEKFARQSLSVLGAAVVGESVVFISGEPDEWGPSGNQEISVWRPGLERAHLVLAPDPQRQIGSVQESGGSVYFDTYLAGPQERISGGSIYVFDSRREVTSRLVTGVNAQWGVAAGRLVTTDARRSLHMVDVANRRETPIPAAMAALGEVDGVAVSDAYALISTYVSDQRSHTWIYRFDSQTAEYVGLNDAQQGGPTGGGPSFMFSAGHRYATTGFDGGPAVIDVTRRIVGTGLPLLQGALYVDDGVAYGDIPIDESRLPDLQSCR